MLADADLALLRALAAGAVLDAATVQRLAAAAVAVVDGQRAQAAAKKRRQRTRVPGTVPGTTPPLSPGHTPQVAAAQQVANPPVPGTEPPPAPLPLPAPSSPPTPPLSPPPLTLSSPPSSTTGVSENRTRSDDQPSLPFVEAIAPIESAEPPAPVARKTTWLTPYADAWVARGGVFVGSREAKALKRLEDEHGAAEVQRRWGVMLDRVSELRYASAGLLLRAWGDFAADAPTSRGGTPAPESLEAMQARVRRNLGLPEGP